KLLPTIASYMRGKTVLEPSVGDPCGCPLWEASFPYHGGVNENKRLTRASARLPLRSTAPLAPTYGVLCGLESALLDVRSRSKGCSISTLLAPVNSTSRYHIPVNAVI